MGSGVDWRTAIVAERPVVYWVVTATVVSIGMLFLAAVFASVAGWVRPIE